MILSWAERNWNFAIYTFMLWFIIPVGAILSGAVAAAGYYFGAKLFHHKPNKIILLNMMAISLGTYFLIKWLDWTYLEVEGRPASEIVSFWQYLDIMISHTSMTMYSHGRAIGNGFELGSLGYLYAAAQIVGFAFGGFVAYGKLAANIYCDSCKRYFLTKGSISRFSENVDSTASMVTSVAGFLKQGNPNQAVAFHFSNGGHEKMQKSDHLRSMITVSNCPVCNKHHFSFVLSKWNGKDWRDVREFSFATFSEQPISIRPSELGSIPLPLSEIQQSNIANMLMSKSPDRIPEILKIVREIKALKLPRDEALRTLKSRLDSIEVNYLKEMEIDALLTGTDS